MNCVACGTEGPVNGAELCVRCDGRDSADRNSPGPVAAIVVAFLVILTALAFIV